MKKKLILVTSPPASGKTYISKMLATNLDHVVYLDKDTLVPLSNVAYKVAGEEINRSSQFFEDNIRNVEYEVVLNFAFEALQYEDIVLINAPFTREIRDTEYMISLRKKLREYDAGITVVWVKTDVEVCKQRMIERNSPRDTWKIANWDEYISKIDFSIPENLNDPSVVDQLLIFNNSSQEEYEESMAKMLKEIQ
ncbi:MAG: ATP-binding protein [Ruminococcaceae bacterium]|nr:ATP-binding protein [Oscillospiraceae bacterium]